ncbi:hypothetical protein BDW72DRAFT_172368 [Aspergillus terricola var. indicus]
MCLGLPGSHIDSTMSRVESSSSRWFCNLPSVVERSVQHHPGLIKVMLQARHVRHQDARGQEFGALKTEDMHRDSVYLVPSGVWLELLQLVRLKSK